MRTEEIQIKNLIKYKPLSRYVGLTGNIPIFGGYTYIGLEVELEGLQNTSTQFLSNSTWRVEDDHSLKYKGKEFITVPIKFKYLEIELKRLFSLLKKPHISKRCSTHVHINVREMTIPELMSFLMLYLIFEKSLYNFSGDRWNNNFCVPLHMSRSYVSELFKVLEKTTQNKDYFNPLWYKYFGLNVCPIYGGDGSGLYGTVEFRQLEGTTDITRIITWINLIVALKIASKKYTPQIIFERVLNMNEDSSYTELARSIFGSVSDHIVNQKTFKKDVEWCIAGTKEILSFMSKDKSIIITEISLTN